MASGAQCVYNPDKYAINPSSVESGYHVKNRASFDGGVYQDGASLCAAEGDYSGDVKMMRCGYVETKATAAANMSHDADRGAFGFDTRSITENVNRRHAPSSLVNVVHEQKVRGIVDAAQGERIAVQTQNAQQRAAAQGNLINAAARNWTAGKHQAFLRSIPYPDLTTPALVRMPTSSYAQRHLEGSPGVVLSWGDVSAYSSTTPPTPSTTLGGYLTQRFKADAPKTMLETAQWAKSTRDHVIPFCDTHGCTVAKRRLNELLTEIAANASALAIEHFAAP